MPAKPIFLYTPDFVVTAECLVQIKRAGYVPVAVASFDCVKILEPLPLAQTDAIARAAFDAIATSNYSIVPENFGRKVAKTLGNPQTAKPAPA